MQIRILNRGLYDTRGEKVILLAVGELHTVASYQGEAPCHSKECKGLWTTRGAFVEKCNFEIVTN